MRTQEENDILTFASSDMIAKHVQWYYMRITVPEIPNIFWDWYHTKGSLVRNENGYNKSMGKNQFPTAEDVISAIYQDISTLQ